MLTKNPQALFSAGQGHSSPKKSRKIIIQGNPDPVTWIKRYQLKQALFAARVNKRARHKLQNPKQPKLTTKWEACTRRYLEFMGLPAKNFAFIAKPWLIAPFPKKFVYELQLLWEPYCSFTDAREAELCCIAMQQQGYSTAQIVQKDLSQS